MEKPESTRIKIFARKLKDGTIKLGNDLIENIKEPEEQLTTSHIGEFELKKGFETFTNNFDRAILKIQIPELYEEIVIPCSRVNKLFGTEDDLKIESLIHWINKCKSMRSKINSEKKKLNNFILTEKERQLERTSNLEFTTKLFPIIMLYIQEKYLDIYKLLDENSKVCTQTEKQAKNEIAILEQFGNLMVYRKGI